MLNRLSTQWNYIKDEIIDQIILGILSLIQVYENDDELYTPFDIIALLEPTGEWLCEWIRRYIPRKQIVHYLKQLGSLSTILYYYINFQGLIHNNIIITTDDGILSKSKMNIYKYEFSLHVLCYLIRFSELSNYCPISVPTNVSLKYDSIHTPNSFIVEGDKNSNDLYIYKYNTSIFIYV